MGNLDSMLDELNNMENSITLRDENGEEVKLYVLEETKLNGESYLLASDTKDGDGECYLLREIHQSRRMQKQLTNLWTMTENWSICPRCLRS